MQRQAHMRFHESLGLATKSSGLGSRVSQRVRVLKNHKRNPNLYYDYYSPNLKHFIIGYLDPPGYVGDVVQDL